MTTMNQDADAGPDSNEAGHEMAARERRKTASSRRRGGRRQVPKAAAGSADNPSVRTRFTSDNQPPRRRGRPPKAEGAEQWRTAFLEEAGRIVRIKEDGKDVTVTAFRSVVRSIIASAEKGNSRSQSYFVDTMKGLHNERTATRLELLKTLMDYRAYWKGELQRRAETGEEGPPPPIDPDAIEIFPDTGEFCIHQDLRELFGTTRDLSHVYGGPRPNARARRAPRPIVLARIKFDPTASTAAVVEVMHVYNLSPAAPHFPDGALRVRIRDIVPDPRELAALTRFVQEEEVVMEFTVLDEQEKKP